jgi:catechol 2,3-dioxygenase-like lactoylglutathione lyase family enzyme
MLRAVSEKRVEVGILVRDPKAQMAFYRDTLGLEQLETLPLPGGVQERLSWGSTVIKLLHFEKMPDGANPPGGVMGGTGIRYITLYVDDLDRSVQKCKDDGHPVPLGPMDFRPGIRVAMIEDPDGNWVELVEGSL